MNLPDILSEIIWLSEKSVGPNATLVQMTSGPCRDLKARLVGESDVAPSANSWL